LEKEPKDQQGDFGNEKSDIEMTDASSDSGKEDGDSSCPDYDLS